MDPLSQVRILDVDALSLEEVHRAFMYTLVRRRPAEAWGKSTISNKRCVGLLGTGHLEEADENFMK